MQLPLRWWSQQTNRKWNDWGEEFLGFGCNTVCDRVQAILGSMPELGQRSGRAKRPHQVTSPSQCCKSKNNIKTEKSNADVFPFDGACSVAYLHRLRPTFAIGRKTTDSAILTRSKHDVLSWMLYFLSFESNRKNWLPLRRPFRRRDCDVSVYPTANTPTCKRCCSSMVSWAIADFRVKTVSAWALYMPLVTGFRGICIRNLKH